MPRLDARLRCLEKERIPASEPVMTFLRYAEPDEPGAIQGVWSSSGEPADVWYVLVRSYNGRGRDVTADVRAELDRGEPFRGKVYCNVDPDLI